MYVLQETGFAPSFQSRKLASYKNRNNAARDFMKFIRNVFASWLQVIIKGLGGSIKQLRTFTMWMSPTSSTTSARR